MRRIASSRLIGCNGSANSSFHTSSGSRSSNGLRKLTGAPVAGKFGFGGKSDIEGEELAFDICQSYKKRSHFGIVPNEEKYFRVASDATGRQPDGAWIMLYFGRTFHADTSSLHLGLYAAEIDVSRKVEVIHARKENASKTLRGAVLTAPSPNWSDRFPGGELQIFFNSYMYSTQKMWLRVTTKLLYKLKFHL